MFRHSSGLAHTRGEVELKHTCDCPRCMTHYERCIQSLVAQVRDLQTQKIKFCSGPIKRLLRLYWLPPESVSPTGIGWPKSCPSLAKHD